MKHLRVLTSIFVLFMAGSVIPMTTSANENYPHPNTYIPTIKQIEEALPPFDRPSNIVGSKYDPKNLLPPELKKIYYPDVNKMKDTWAEIVGFRSSDIVGKIAPEVKPGKYSYKDLEDNPGLKELMVPSIYDIITPGAPPFAGNIPEFEIIPTNQQYWNLPLAEATKANMGKTKLDANGYIKEDTWVSGFPFPRPSGPHKAQQYVYNIVKRYDLNGFNSYLMSLPIGIDKNLKIDQWTSMFSRIMRFSGRTTLKPYGWYDDNAKKRAEEKIFLSFAYEPRDLYGTVFAFTYFNAAEKQTQNLI